MSVSLVDDILRFFNAAVIFSMMGIGILFYALGWFLYIEKEHRPISLFIFRSIQTRCYIEVHAKRKEKGGNSGTKKKFSAVAKQLKAMGS